MVFAVLARPMYFDFLKLQWVYQVATPIYISDIHIMIRCFCGTLNSALSGYLKDLNAF